MYCGDHAWRSCREGEGKTDGRRGGRETWCAVAVQFVDIGRACAIGPNQRARRSRHVSETLLYRASILQRSIITTTCFRPFVDFETDFCFSFVTQRSVNVISQMRLFSLFYTRQNRWGKIYPSLSKLMFCHNLINNLNIFFECYSYLILWWTLINFTET